MGEMSKNTFVVVKNNFFLQGVHLGQKNMFVVKRDFCVSTRFYSLDGINSGQHKKNIWSQKHIFACPQVTSSLEGVHTGQKNIYF